MKNLRKSVLGSWGRSGASQLSVLMSYYLLHYSEKRVSSHSMPFILFKSGYQRSTGKCLLIRLSHFNKYHQRFTNGVLHHSPFPKNRGSITYPIPKFPKSILDRTCTTCGWGIQMKVNVLIKITYTHTYLQLDACTHKVAKY